jgi:hypothetical protein
MRFVLRARRNWSVRSLAHVSLRPSGTAGRLPRLVGERLAMVVQRNRRGRLDIEECEGSGVAWVLERAEVIACGACGFEGCRSRWDGLHSPCTWIVAFTAGEVILRPSTQSLLVLSDGADGQRFTGTVSRRSDDGLQRERRADYGQRPSSRPRNAPATRRAEIGHSGHPRPRHPFRFCHALPSNLRFVVLVQQSNPLFSCLIHHRAE